MDVTTQKCRVDWSSLPWNTLRYRDTQESKRILQTLGLRFGFGLEKATTKSSKQYCNEPSPLPSPQSLQNTTFPWWLVPHDSNLEQMHDTKSMRGQAAYEKITKNRNGWWLYRLGNTCHTTPPKVVVVVYISTIALSNNSFKPTYCHT